jgi:hypothetical protein
MLYYIIPGTTSKEIDNETQYNSTPKIKIKIKLDAFNHPYSYDKKTEI